MSGLGFFYGTGDRASWFFLGEVCDARDGDGAVKFWCGEGSWRSGAFTRELGDY